MTELTENEQKSATHVASGGRVRWRCKKIAPTQPTADDGAPVLSKPDQIPRISSSFCTAPLMSARGRIKPERPGTG